MGKVQVKKKDARIDMTAMSDVTVLLLTFFMLTSTFLAKEPVQVITPPSVSEEKVPLEKLMTVLVSPKGEVFLELTGTSDSTLGSSAFREAALKNVVAEYNKHYKPEIQLTQAEVEIFKKQQAFGCPLKDLKSWLNKEQDERDQLLKTMGGIPIKLNFDENNPTEFQMWTQAVYAALENAGVQEDMESGKGIAIKADQSTPYDKVETVMNNLQTVKMNRFTLMTALKAPEGGDKK